tara:strand:- start:304 stop:561 length:258 start_codon:yes stop_codon:yes gene_type:complete
MITIEEDEDFNETKVTILDTTESYEDVEMIIDHQAEVFFRQWDENEKRYQVIGFTSDMYRKLMEAWNLPHGIYHFRKDVDYDNDY